MPVACSPTEFATVLQGRNEQGQPIFSVLVKRTYQISEHRPARRLDRARPFVATDEYYEDSHPDWGIVKYESDYAPCKAGTDVVLIGQAFAPDAKPARQLDAQIEVGSFRKAVRVIGDRHCIYRSQGAPLFSEPLPFLKMPLRYDRAYGGRDLRSNPEEPFYYPRNDIGVGFVLRNSREVVDGLPLPNLEDPQDLLTPDRLIVGHSDRWSQQPLPDGTGWMHRAWYPRCSFTGAFPAYLEVDTILREETLGLVPKHQIALAQQFRLPGFDVRFHNGASRGLVLPQLAGDEFIRLTNLTASGSLEFRLPGETPRITLDIGLGENELTSFLQTVSLRPEELELDLIWRGVQPYPGWSWLPEMKKMTAAIVD